MDSNKNATPPLKQQTLRQPVQIVKKHSGPLDDLLAELNSGETVSLTTGKNFGLKEYHGNTANVASTPTRRRLTLKDKDKKRERWLLTRKTWRYMTDAGRKLIPDGIQNRQEDIPKIEAHFQKVCASEPHFVPWRRKYSYPGAIRNSKKRLKQLLQHTGQKSQQVLEREEANNADLLLELLHSYLKLDEAIKTDTLLGTKTEGPHQTNSPSAQRPKPLTSNIRRRDALNVSLRGPGFLPPISFVCLEQQSSPDQLLQQLLRVSRSTTLSNTINIPPEIINASLLEDKATLKKIYNALKKQQLHRILSKHSMPLKQGTDLTVSTSMLSLVNFDSNHTSIERDTEIANKSYKIKLPKDTTIISSIPALNSSSLNTTTAQKENNVTHSSPNVPQRQRKPPTSLNLSGYSDTSSTIKNNQRHRQIVPEKQFNSCGTQTNFISLNEIKRLAKEYKDYNRGELVADRGSNATTDDEYEKQVSFHSNRRKSSIDNEDISQSVSDTIKRYLRMARKKSVHEDNTNRFKRVNYDRNLRNIRPKGEILPPGIDEFNNKAVQTLDAWALITLDFIRGDVNYGLLETAHRDWQQDLNDRLRRKLEYERKINQTLTGTNQSTSSCSSSAPTSPMSNQSPTTANMTSALSSCMTKDPINVVVKSSAAVDNKNGENDNHVSGIFHSGSQFIANLWHGYTSQSNLSSPTSLMNEQKHAQLDPSLLTDESDATINRVDMKKSKSLTHIGHYVSIKLLKGHPKNPSKIIELFPMNSSIASGMPKWSRSGKYCWTSQIGEYILLRDTAFHALSELETKMVKDICIEKIIQLDIGIDLNDLTEVKSQKKHTLTKMRAMTTNFFDIGKKDSSTFILSNFGKKNADQNLSLFGNSLEECVISDKKLGMPNLATFSNKRSRNSIASLLRYGNCSGTNIEKVIDPGKLKENICFSENVPTESETLFDNENVANKTDDLLFLSKSFENMPKLKNISCSQSDVRRLSHDNSNCSPTLGNLQIFKELNVPTFVMSCIHFLEENGLHKVGIFRVCTSKKKTKQIRDSLDKNIEKFFNKDTCPHNVATLLKEFLRDLREPLLSNRLYESFLKTQKIRNRRLQLEALSHLVKLLPPAHLDTLYVLLKFLAKVASFSDDICDNDGALQLTGNKMDSNNLATVFAPNILRSTINYKSSSGEHIETSKEHKSIDDAINVIRIMIDHYEELFLVPADILDDIFSHLLDAAPEQLNAICEYHKTIMQNCLHLF